MKLMDTLAGVVTYRHAQMACVTVSIGKTMFLRFLEKYFWQF